MLFNKNVIKVHVANSRLDTLIRSPSESEESDNNQENYGSLPLTTNSLKRSPCLNGGTLIRGIKIIINYKWHNVALIQLIKIKDGEPCQCLAGYTGSLCGISLDELSNKSLTHSREKRFELALLILVLGFVLISIAFIIICCN